MIRFTIDRSGRVVDSSLVGALSAFGHGSDGAGERSVIRAVSAVVAAGADHDYDGCPIYTAMKLDTQPTKYQAMICVGDDLRYVGARS